MIQERADLHAHCPRPIFSVPTTGTAQASAFAAGVAGLCLANMEVCDFSNSIFYGSSREPPRNRDFGPPAWPTPPESLWFTKQASDAVYKCMTVGSASDKGLTMDPELKNVTRLGGYLNVTGVIRCCQTACNVSRPMGVTCSGSPGGGNPGGGRQSGESRSPGEGYEGALEQPPVGGGEGPNRPVDPPVSAPETTPVSGPGFASEVTASGDVSEDVAEDAPVGGLGDGSGGEGWKKVQTQPCPWPRINGKCIG